MKLRHEEGLATRAQTIEYVPFEKGLGRADFVTLHVNLTRPGEAAEPTFHLMDEFARSFHEADSLFVMDIYAASEKPIAGVSAQALVERIRAFGHRGAEYVGTLDAGVDALMGAAADGDLVLTLGAGSVWQAGDKVLARLGEGS